MKKIFISLMLAFSFLFSTTYWYNMTVKDEKIVNKINNKIDLIYKKSPIKVEKIYNKIQKILNTKLKWKENSRIYVLIDWINTHLEEILKKNKEADNLDLNNLLLWEEIKKEEVKKVQNEYYTDKKWRRFKYYDINDKSYLNKWFSCSKKKYCKNMSSCEEATYYYKVCWAKWFDRDNDYIPCENICWEKIK